MGERLPRDEVSAQWLAERRTMGPEHGVVIICAMWRAGTAGSLDQACWNWPPAYIGHPRMSSGVRNLVWEVLSDWYSQLCRGSIPITWGDGAAQGRLGSPHLASRPKVGFHDAMLLVRRHLPTTTSPLWASQFFDIVKVNNALKARGFLAHAEMERSNLRLMDTPSDDIHLHRIGRDPHLPNEILA